MAKYASCCVSHIKPIANCKSEGNTCGFELLDEDTLFASLFSLLCVHSDTYVLIFNG